MKITRLLIIFAIAAATLGALFAVVRLFPDSDKGSTADKTQSVHSPMVSDGTKHVAVEDLLAVASNIVRGSVVSLKSAVYSDSLEYNLVLLDVKENYASVEEIDYEKDNTVSFMYNASLHCNLAVGDECIVVLSRTDKAAGVLPKGVLESDYVVVEPEYSIIVESDDGFHAKNFMRIAAPHLYRAEQSSYSQDDVEHAIHANRAKLKSLNVLQLAPLK
ncbi:MAG: hypothetical protein IJO93_03770 [Clostridia bacterium]|nr:hypothetical protein [Clostridia bacterium]